MKKIIVFRTDRLGDFIICSRPIYDLKKKYPNSKITIVCSNLNKKILSEFNYIDKLIVFNKKFSFIKKIKIFFKIISDNYFASFVLDGKNFSYLCNMFINSKSKFGISYVSCLKIFNFNLKFYKPFYLYNLFFFKKFETFTSKDSLIKSENLCQKYLNLFNFFKLNLKIADKYIFQNNKITDKKFLYIKKKIKLKNYILIHLDEKWIDVFNKNSNIVNGINLLSRNTKNQIIITSYKNKNNYFLNIKKKYDYFDYKSNSINKLKKSNILIIDNLDIFLFERFIKESKINISCHSGFLVQVSGANESKIIDIINKNDHKWYNCWRPSNTFHKFIFKSDINNKKIKPEIFFNKISDLINNL